jgi:hypothetical protein
MIFGVGNGIGQGTSKQAWTEQRMVKNELIKSSRVAVFFMVFSFG